MAQEVRHFWLALFLSLCLNALGMAAFCLMLHAQRGTHVRAFELIGYGDGGDGLPVGAATVEGGGAEAAEARLDHDVHAERAVSDLAVDVVMLADPTLLLPDVLPEPAPPKSSAGAGTKGPPGGPAGGGTSGTGSGRGGQPGARHGVRLLDSTPPSYPEAARQQGVEGRVVIHLTISAEGHVTEAKLHHSSGSTLLDDAALRHARTRRFAPARHDGLPVVSTALYPLEFRLTDRR